MFLPEIKVRNKTTMQYTSFLGLDERSKINDASFNDMLNMSSDEYPCLCPREARTVIADGFTKIQGAICPKYEDSEITAFTGVADNYFYYNGEKISNIRLLDGEKEIVDFYGRLCIFPDKVYYSYLPNSETGNIGTELLKMEKQMTISGAVFYSYIDKFGENYSAYIKKTGAGFDECFKTGDSVVISGSGDNDTFVLDSKFKYAASDEIVSVVVESAESDKLNIRCYSKTGELLKFKSNQTISADVTIKIAIPDMSHVCVHNNRLWGTGVSGEFIYSSKLGDPFSFNSFEGLSTDSWYSEVGTEGEFTGISSYKSAVIAFKRNYIHHIYGDTPSNFQLPKQISGGCISGRTISELDGVLYYLSDKGIMGYSGGNPYCISSNITRKYTGGSGGNDGTKYYLSLEHKLGTDVLVYDIRYETWHKEDNTKYIGFLTKDSQIYGYSSTTLEKLSGGSEVVEWSVTSKAFTHEDMRMKGFTRIYLRLDVPNGAEVNIFVMYDENRRFELVKTIKGTGFKTFRVPIRFRTCDSYRIKLSGKGRVIIHDIEKEVSQNGYMEG